MDKTPQELLREVDKAEETPLIVENTDADFAQRAVQLESAGYCYIYDRKSGDRSKTNNNMLPTQLKKKNKDGSLRFSTVKPENPIEPVKVGTIKCMLHASDPNRAHYDSLGLPVCKKHNITSQFHLRRHMMHRHKVEWDSIEQERIDKEKQEERDFQRSIISAAGLNIKSVEAPPVYVSNKDRKVKDA